MLAAARQLQAEVGYDRASIEAIAERAGVAKTGIYRRWPNKAVLMYHAVIDAGPGNTDVPDTGDLRADLLAVLTANARGLLDPRFREMIATLLAECMRDPELARLLREGFFGPRADAIAARVRVAVERGEVRETIDADLVPALLTGPLQYLVIVRGSDLGEDDLRRVVDAVVGP